MNTKIIKKPLALLLTLPLLLLPLLVTYQSSLANSVSPVTTQYLPFIGHTNLGLCNDELFGYVIAEVEEHSNNGWEYRNGLSGFSGDGYYHWSGPNLPHPISNDNPHILRYRIQINDPGAYHLRVRNQHNHPDPTEENDMWLRVNDGEWEKTFSPEPNVWTWSTYIDFEVAGMPQEFDPTYNLDAGLHTIEIAPRSEGFNIDRILLTKNNPADYYDASIPTTPSCTGWAQP